MRVLVTPTGHQVKYEYFDEDAYFAIFGIVPNNNKVIKDLGEFQTKLSYLFEDEMNLDGTMSEEALQRVDEEIEWYLYQHNI